MQPQHLYSPHPSTPMGMVGGGYDVAALPASPRNGYVQQQMQPQQMQPQMQPDQKQQMLSLVMQRNQLLKQQNSVLWSRSNLDRAQVGLPQMQMQMQMKMAPVGTPDSRGWRPGVLAPAVMPPPPRTAVNALRFQKVSSGQRQNSARSDAHPRPATGIGVPLRQRRRAVRAMHRQGAGLLRIGQVRRVPELQGAHRGEPIGGTRLARVADRGGEPRARSHCRFAPPRTRFIPDSLTHSVALFLRRHMRPDPRPRAVLTSATSCAGGRPPRATAGPATHLFCAQRPRSSPRRAQRSTNSHRRRGRTRRASDRRRPA
jgi:hypothetical protein